MSIIQTYSGASLDFLSPDENSICLKDIAHGLANTCRFGGQGKVFYSVAQHSILVAQLSGEVNSYCYKWGLFHDAAEAYMNDLPTPLKGLLPRYKSIETKLLKVIADRFSLYVGKYLGIPPYVKKQDALATISEACVLMNVANEPILWEGFPEPITDLISINDCWNPEKAESEFLKVVKECGYDL